MTEKTLQILNQKATFHCASLSTDKITEPNGRRAPKSGADGTIMTGRRLLNCV